VTGEKIFNRLQSTIAYSTWRECLTQKVGLKEGEDFSWPTLRRGGEQVTLKERREKALYRQATRAALLVQFIHI
jgi:hypothetical protein